MKRNNIQIKTILIALIVLVTSCAGNKQPSDLSWYQGQVIEQLVEEDSAVYRVQIGIMASSFWLDKENEDFKKDLSLLQESLQDKKKLDIGVEKETNKIRVVKATR
ncbi:hypothetical protein ACFS6H_06145 [Terrimonas rubra]|uniref:Uncharacterized protein n=1 Tax=Terrimonas rubra TaxID=1035890 RepID=A0ABW6A320_9BACT